MLCNRVPGGTIQQKLAINCYEKPNKALNALQKDSLNYKTIKYFNNINKYIQIKN